MRRFLTRTAVGLAIAGGAFGMTAATASPAEALEIRLSDVLVSSVTAEDGTISASAELGGLPIPGAPIIQRPEKRYVRMYIRTQ
jgi:hypothetical protein